MLSMKTSKDLNKPSKMTETKTIKNLADLKASTASYRSDLAAAASIRYAKVFRGSSAKKGFKAKKSNRAPKTGRSNK
jgi:hypothetical protein